MRPMDQPKSPPNVTKATQVAAKLRQQRRAEALRANLRRRKEQTRARAAAAGEGDKTGGKTR